MEINIALLLKQLFLSLEQYARKQMKDFNISPSQGLALNYLFSQKDRTVYATDLHAQFGISKSAVSSTLKGLKKKGYLQMISTPEDDRKKQITLTAKAYAIKKQMDTSFVQLQNRLCQGISPENLEKLENELTIMLQNMRQQTIRREPA